WCIARAHHPQGVPAESTLMSIAGYDTLEDVILRTDLGIYGHLSPLVYIVEIIIKGMGVPIARIGKAGIGPVLIIIMVQGQSSIDLNGLRVGLAKQDHAGSCRAVMKPAPGNGEISGGRRVTAVIAPTGPNPQGRVIGRAHDGDMIN